MPAEPISDSEFAALMAPLLAPGPVMVAVSGGADSMALALLLRRWGMPVAVIVDHGLRLDSAQEAARARARLEAVGVPARVVRLALTPGPDLGARARAARYAALLGACRAAGLIDLAVAHHAEDQAETLALRRAGGSGPDGLAAMPAIAWRAEARILRPLLAVPRARLRATLRAAGVGWEEDPSNRAGARGALRRAGLPVAPLWRAAALAGRGRAQAERELAEELAARVTLDASGIARLSGPLTARAWSALVWTLSGAPYPPPREGAERLARAGQGTLSGVLALASGWVGREPAAAAPAVVAVDGVCWDGRFRLRGQVQGGLTLGALGREVRDLRRRPGPPSQLLSALPALRRDGVLACVPHLVYPEREACRNIVLDFRPARPLAGAGFVAAPWPGPGGAGRGGRERDRRGGAFG